MNLHEIFFTRTLQHKKFPALKFPVFCMGCSWRHFGLPTSAFGRYVTLSCILFIGNKVKLEACVISPTSAFGNQLHSFSLMLCE